MVKNANKKAIEKGSDRIFDQGSSKGIMAAWGEKMAADIGVLNPQHYTGHSWGQRTGATCLAEEGISETVLKHPGQWKSATAALVYINNNKEAREKQLTILNFLDKNSGLITTTATTTKRLPTQTNYKQSTTQTPTKTMTK